MQQPYQQQGQGQAQHHPNMYPVQHPGQSHQPQQGQYGVYANQPQSPGAYGSQPTLPRYASTTSMQGGPGGAHSPTLSPLNPHAQQQQPQQQHHYQQYQPQQQQQQQYNQPRQGGAYNQSAANQGGNGYQQGLNARYSTYGHGNGGPGAQGGAHPLSHALYADSPSSPTLAGDHESTLDEKKGLASFPPSSSSSSGDSRSAQNQPGAHNGASGFKRISGAFASAVEEERRTKQERIGWLDGLRFIAAWIVINATFFNATVTDPNSYSAIQRSSPAYIFRSFGLGLCFFLLILGRALSAPLWDVPVTNANSGKELGKYGSTGAPTIAFARLTRAMLTRVFRFILPVMVVAALLWILGATNATRDCNAAGMQQPYWNMISRFAGYVTVIFNSFYAFEYLTTTAKTFTANLWTNAWFWQSSYAVYIVHMMLGNLSSARYWIYAILGFFMWTTNNYFAVAIIGLAITDVAVHGQFARIRSWPVMRVIALQIILLAIGFAFEFVNPIRNNLNSAFATINVGDHDDIAICDVILATCIFLVIETSTIAQFIFGNVVMRYLGKLAPGMYLLCPAIVYTLVPTLGVSLSNGGTGGSGVLGVTWVVTFAISVVAAIPFYFFVEIPSKLAGEAFANLITKWGALPDDGAKAQVKAPGAPAPKKISGPGGK